MTDALTSANKEKSIAAQKRLVEKVELLEKAFELQIQNPLGVLSKCKSITAIAEFDGLDLKPIKNRKPLYDNPEIKARYEKFAAKIQSYMPSDSEEVRVLKNMLNESKNKRDQAVLALEKLVESFVISTDRERSATESLNSALARIDRLTLQNRKLLKERDNLKRSQSNVHSVTVVT
ncbi:hypothetical protein ABFY09_12830 [Marinomonas sp. 5E14-1]|uniref:hypothetical protein n=1 Tax=Marinomonas sp. 5E14-1 TaxID=3153922 RepID=UPI003265D1AC